MAGTFDHRHQAYTPWNRDFGISEAGDLLYKSIPFFLASTSDLSYGLFLGNTWRTWSISANGSGMHIPSASKVVR